jgi:putative CocE/NonD family hydrolase
LDHWVKGVDNGVDREPPVQVYSMGAGAWRTGERWPLPTEPLALYLNQPATSGSAGLLSPAAPTSSSASSSLSSDPANPIRDPFAERAGPHDYRALSERRDVLTFETAPLAEDVEAVGPIQAQLYISCDKPDTDLWVKLLDVSPDGTAFNLMSPGLDVIRASYREKKPTRDLLQPGKVYRLDLNTLLTANRFLRGHRIRIAVMTSFAPHMSRNLHSGLLEMVSDQGEKATITIHHDRRYPSRIVLPVLDGQSDGRGGSGGGNH